MRSGKMVTAEHSPASGVSVILVPGWRGKPLIIAREDGKDAITVAATRCHEREMWRLVVLRDGRLCRVAYLSSQRSWLRRLARRIVGSPFGKRRIQRNVWDMTIAVPPERFGIIKVDTRRHGGG